MPRTTPTARRVRDRIASGNGVVHRLPAGLSMDHVHRHVIAPAHTKGIRIEEIDPHKERFQPIPAARKAFPTTPRVDLGAMGLALHTILKDQVVGYVLQVNQAGTLVHNGIWNWARTPADAGAGWTATTRMHVASVSKLLTAVGMVRALERNGLSPDDRIAPYLPTYWKQGKNIGEITFGQLLTHRSGFGTGGSGSDFALMKAKVAAGVSETGGYDYENMNFGLCRILIPVVNRDIPAGASFVSGPLNDQAWDVVTLMHFRRYMQDQVFSPAGVKDVGFVPTPTSALAYRQPSNGEKGWDSGDLSTVAGGAGFRLSVEELLRVMGRVRRGRSILAPSTAQQLLDSRFGIDQVIDTPAGTLYNKNGAWGTGAGHTEQCVAYFLPDDMELALFVNSPIGDGISLRRLVQDAFVSCLKG